LDAQLPHAGRITFCTDFWHPHGVLFEKHEHLQGKARPFTIESHNNRLRCHLARLRRKTHCHTKKLANLAARILLYLLNK
jgi:IS1 family transposase